jgi:hypothetical protein
VYDELPYKALFLVFIWPLEYLYRASRIIALVVISLIYNNVSYIVYRIFERCISNNLRNNAYLARLIYFYLYNLERTKSLYRY